MNALEQALREHGEYIRLEESLKKNKNASLGVSGCKDSDKINIINALSSGYKYTVIVTNDAKKAREMYEDFAIYNKNVILYPAKDFLFLNAEIHGNYIISERLNVIKNIIENNDSIIITTIDGLMDKLIPVEIIEENVIMISSQDSLDLEEVKSKLVNMAYERVSQVQGPGQFAMRGEILDIFPVTEESPVRIDLWGDEIDSIKYFDVESQRSIENIEDITIYPACEYIMDRDTMLKGIEKIKADEKKVESAFRKKMEIESGHRISVIIKEFLEMLRINPAGASVDSYINYFYDDLSTLEGYLNNSNTLYVLDEPVKLKEKSTAVFKEFKESMVSRLEKGYILPGQTKVLNDYKAVIDMMKEMPKVSFFSINNKAKELAITETFQIDSRSVVSYNNSLEILAKDLKSYRKKNYRVLILASSTTRAKRFADGLWDYGIEAIFSDNKDRVLKPREVIVMSGNVRQGYEYPLVNFVVITQTDIFGKERHKKKKHKSRFQGRHVQDFNELSVGDYVVHENHGLGVYRGVEKIEVDGVFKDYIKIEYAGNSNLYILATQLDMLQKYAGADTEKVPKINKLGSQEWYKTKYKVKGAVKDIAKELVELYSARQNRQGFAYSKDTVWQKEFEETFPYEETSDQLKAIEETKLDMESHKIMDRLICGDVGYGKTEIAIRAAFKAVQDGKQVAFLVPTTILAKQHYNTFVQRMKNYPVRIDMLSRFRTSKEVDETIKGLKSGEVDIVIGTHKILNKSIKYKDLGLLIVDEEQRFGVTHKEKLKEIKQNVDVLTLTATPIPRTLHMSLAGIRDMSVLEEAPVDRVPIQTYVMEYDKEIIREAINRELARGGQVYYVYNRVNNIQDVAMNLQSLLGDANVVYAHGRMPKGELEQIMFDFVQGDIDVLVSTTIIETGLDISNVNTIIIHDADRFGLSQLYQLRGRVGRSGRTAYAFMLYKRDKILKEEAEKRLKAIREFTELGSGFKISMRDLEIRGAGNVLGAQQHGHMAAVGYDLYCKLLNEAVMTLKGEEVLDEFETKIDLDVDAYIPSSYIKNEMQKLNVYKRIASIENEEDYFDMQDELMDRFGEMPKNVMNLLSIAYVKAMAHKAWVTEITNVKASRDTNWKNVIKIEMYPQAKIKVEEIPKLIESYKGKLKFIQESKPYFMVETGTKELNMDEYKEVILEFLKQISF